MTDLSRIRNTNPTNSSFVVTFWYPAETRAGVLPDAYVDKKITLVPDSDGNPSYWLAPDTVAKFVSHALPGLPLATNQTSYPVLLYSHGAGGHRRQFTGTAQELASHGYIVVAMEHYDAFASVFPSGQVVLAEVLTYGGCSQEAIDFEWPDKRANRVKDLQFMVDELSRLNTDDVLLGGRLDWDRLGAFGVSWGGFTSAEFGRIDARCKAVVVLDAGVTLVQSTNLTQLGLQKPFLSMNAIMGWIDCPLLGEWLASSLALFAKATNDAFWCQVQDSTHWSFSDRGSLINDPTKMADPTPASRAQSTAISACTLSFFDRYLKNQDDHLLDNPAAVYPNIINFQSK
jgi:dienelactone hydrolase